MGIKAPSCSIKINQLQFIRVRIGEPRRERGSVVFDVLLASHVSVPQKSRDEVVSHTLPGNRDLP